MIYIIILEQDDTTGNKVLLVCKSYNVLYLIFNKKM